jgi:hypothetical protein
MRTTGKEGRMEIRGINVLKNQKKKERQTRRKEKSKVG